MALSRAPAVALLVASTYGVALVVAAFVVPVYDSDTSSSSGGTTKASETLVGVNGLSAAVLLAVPLVVTLAVGCALWQGSRRGAPPIAWTLTGLLAAANLLAMLSVGVFFLPVTAALIVACAKSRPPARLPGTLTPRPAGF